MPRRLVSNAAMSSGLPCTTTWVNSVGRPNPPRVISEGNPTMRTPLDARLATSSLHIIDFATTADDVTHATPDPEIFSRRCIAATATNAQRTLSATARGTLELRPLLVWRA